MTINVKVIQIKFQKLASIFIRLFIKNPMLKFFCSVNKHPAIYHLFDFQIHSTFSSLEKVINPSCLPKEYGGKMPMDEMIAGWKRELLGKRSIVTSLDDMDIVNTNCLTARNGSDENNNPGKNNYYSLPGSFRKLEVD